jgi:hypothetical protein
MTYLNGLGSTIPGILRHFLLRHAQSGCHFRARGLGLKVLI